MSGVAELVDRIGGCFPGVRVEVLDDRVVRVCVDAALAGGLDELVVAELVRVLLVEHRVGRVDHTGDRLDVRPSDEGVRRVASFEHARVVEVVRADDSDAGLEARARRGEPSVVEVEVVGSEEGQRLARGVVAVVDLARVARSARWGNDHVRSSGLQLGELGMVVGRGDEQEPVRLGRRRRDARDQRGDTMGPAEDRDDDDGRCDHRVRVTLRFLRL